MNRKNKGNRSSSFRRASLFAFICLLLLPGCASSPKVLLTEKQLFAAEANNSGDDAFRKGRYDRARHYYSEALRINRSIEDEEGIAVNLINLSAAFRKAGDHDAALRLVEELTGESELRFEGRYVAEGYYLGALIYLDRGNLESAGELNDHALALCAEIRCPGAGKMLNVKARIELGRGQLEDAKRSALEALKENQDAKAEGEMANSVRLLGEIARIGERYDDAVRYLEEAFRIDKKLEMSLKMAADLMELGHLFYDQGKCDQALHYFKRAHDVAASSAGGELAKDKALKMISRCASAGKE